MKTTKLILVVFYIYVEPNKNNFIKQSLFSKRIGHKNISTTIDKYGHFSPLVKQDFAKETDKYY